MSTVTSRKRFEVYVEIPYLTSMNSLKRKPSQSEVPEAAAKKPKLVDTNAVKENTTGDGVQDVAKSKNIDASVEFPNGHLYCHQCNKKRDAALVIQCTSLAQTDKSCRAKYCKPCMINRYGQDIESIRSTVDKKPGATHEYTFQCPRCQGICNCRACRKAQGLEPTGNLTLAGRKAGKSAAQLLDANPEQLGILPGKGQQVIPEKKSRTRTNKKELPKPATASTSAPRKPKPKRAKKPNASLLLPQPKWSQVPVPTEMSLQDLETRIFIREFMMRFSTIMNKDAAAHLDELEEIAGDGSIEWTADNNESDDGTDEEESQLLVSWVSEGCVKSVFIGLLGLLAECVNPAHKKSVAEALKQVRTSSANLTKIWAALAVLRRNLQSQDTFDIPDPLPPPSSMPIYHTRRGVVLDPCAEGMHVGRSAQLIPVMASLIEGLLLVSKAVKAEIDSGVNESKEMVKQAKEAISKENERWKIEKDKSGGKPNKEAREVHKRNLLDLEEAQRMLMYGSIPRFGPIGTDDEGRVYYTLSPGLTERGHAAELISGETARKPKRGRKVAPGGAIFVAEEERKSLNSWSWFLAVWGKKPANVLDNGTEEKDDENEKWWGFWEPQQIKDLAQWIANRNELDDVDYSTEILSAGSTAVVSGVGVKSDTASNDDVPDALTITGDGSSLSDLEDDEEDENGAGQVPPPSSRALKNLVDGLNNYASLLHWRVEEGERERQIRAL